MGYVHSDIKPDNILYGIGRDQNQLNLIDYGGCQKFRQGSKGETQIFNGNYWFASPFVINGRIPSWRDDVIQVVYVLIYLSTKLKNLQPLVDG